MGDERLFEIRRRTFDAPELRGMEFIEVEAKTIVNKVPGDRLPFRWTINPYRGCAHACSYCFARVTHTYMEMDAGRDFESKIVVKVNAPQLLRRELRSRRWTGETIAMGTATDPYQRAEGRYALMRPIIAALSEVANPFSVLTKGTLILRDLDLLQDAARRARVTTALSVPTLDEDLWRSAEPGTPHPRRRLDAVRALNDAGVPCGVMVAPILPGLSDSDAGLREVIRAAVDAGATHVTPIALHLRPVVREHFFAWLDDYAPGRRAGYEALFGEGAYQASARRRALARRVERMVSQAGGTREQARPSEPEERVSSQLRLFG